MRTGLLLFSAGVLTAMLAVTVRASLDRSVLDAAVELWRDPWGRATLFDAYFGFLTVWLWIAYREADWGTRLVWLAALLLLGNIAIALYLGRAVWQLAPDASAEQLLLRRREAGRRW